MNQIILSSNIKYKLIYVQAIGVVCYEKKEEEFCLKNLFKSQIKIGSFDKKA